MCKVTFLTLHWTEDDLHLARLHTSQQSRNIDEIRDKTSLCFWFGQTGGALSKATFEAGQSNHMMMILKVEKLPASGVFQPFIALALPLPLPAGYSVAVGEFTGDSEQGEKADS